MWITKTLFAVCVMAGVAVIAAVLWLGLKRVIEGFAATEHAFSTGEGENCEGCENHGAVEGQ
jgi:hypothetical protein